MPRRPNTSPTNIYWLYDMRPETLLSWPKGYPFYCGKTIKSSIARLKEHQRQALIGDRPVHQWVRACGNNIRVATMQIVPLETNWCEAERFWIRVLRTLSPVVANVNEGGAGMPGYIRTAEQREANRLLHTGRKRSLKTRRRIALARTGANLSPETRAKMSLAAMGNKHAAGPRKSRPKKIATPVLSKPKAPISKRDFANQRQRRLDRLAKVG